MSALLLSFSLAVTPIVYDGEVGVFVPQAEAEELHRRDLQLDLCTERVKRLDSDIQMLENELAKPLPEERTPSWMTWALISIGASVVIGGVIGASL